MDLRDQASSVGLTVFIRRDVFEKGGHFNAESLDRGRMIEGKNYVGCPNDFETNPGIPTTGLRKEIAPRHLRWEWKHFERDYGMYINTKLSGHFTHWPGQSPLKSCKVRTCDPVAILPRPNLPAGHTAGSKL